MALNVALARARREALGLTLEEAARRIGVTHAALWRWEAGKREPRNSDTLRRWARVLQLEPADLYADPDPQPEPEAASG